MPQDNIFNKVSNLDLLAVKKEGLGKSAPIWVSPHRTFLQAHFSGPGTWGVQPNLAGGVCTGEWHRWAHPALGIQINKPQAPQAQLDPSLPSSSPRGRQVGQGRSRLLSDQVGKQSNSTEQAGAGEWGEEGGGRSPVSITGLRACLVGVPFLRHLDQAGLRWNREPRLESRCCPSRDHFELCGTSSGKQNQASGLLPPVAPPQSPGGTEPYVIPSPLPGYGRDQGQRGLSKL